MSLFAILIPLITKKLGRSLLAKRGKALVSILGEAQSKESARLYQHTLRQGAVKAAFDGGFSKHYRKRSPLPNRTHEVPRFLQGSALRDNVIDDAELARLLSFEPPTRPDQLFGKSFAYYSRKCLGAGRTGHKSEPRLGKTKLRCLASNNKVTKKGKLEASAECVPFDSGNRRLGELWQRTNKLISFS